MLNSCIFSVDQKYRYFLGNVAEVNRDRGICVFIGLNPSTADEHKFDPTVRRCRNYATAWGYSKLVMLNAYAYRSTDPKGMFAASDPIGPDNDDYLEHQIYGSDLVVAAWGNHITDERQEQILSIAHEQGQDVYALRVTKEGRPSHPLYLPKDLKPTLWRPWMV